MLGLPVVSLEAVSLNRGVTGVMRLPQLVSPATRYTGRSFTSARHMASCSRLDYEWYK